MCWVNLHIPVLRHERINAYAVSRHECIDTVEILIGKPRAENIYRQQFLPAQLELFRGKWSYPDTGAPRCVCVRTYLNILARQ